MNVEVVHPVSYRYRMARARVDRHGFGKGRTHVEIREVTERPREALRIGNHRILAAEGHAWTVLQEGGTNVAPAELSEFLAGRILSPDHALSAWARRSPLYFDHGNDQGRLGHLDIAGAREVDGAETASADVRAFLDAHVRTHGDRLLVREERVVGIDQPWRAKPSLRLVPNPRDPNAAIRSFVAVRPDRLPQAWETGHKARRSAAPAGEWSRLAEIPPELRGDTDALFAANNLPGILASHAREAARSGHGGPAAGLARLLPEYEALDRRGATFALRGAEAASALDLIAEGVSLMGARRLSQLAGRNGDPEADNAVRTWRFVRAFIDAELLPRLTGREAGRIDEEGLSSLAPR